MTADEIRRALYAQLDDIKAEIEYAANPFDLPDASGRDEIIMHMLGELEGETVVALTPWEVDFVASVGGRFERGGALTERQFATLQRIYAEKTA